MPQSYTKTLSPTKKNTEIVGEKTPFFHIAFENLCEKSL
jgi:hypothetical protein